MEVDWGQAWEIGLTGFGLVFGVLVVLALAMWLTGWVLHKMGSDTDTADKKQES
jgi:Na+-transporting methylmalonyl-CoA/oxaloacetate decarboxylase gamma subunit